MTQTCCTEERLDGSAEKLSPSRKHCFQAFAGYLVSQTQVEVCLRESPQLVFTASLRPVYLTHPTYNTHVRAKY